ncbi:MAG TPA: AAA family ATPase, partial [Solirubrobacteraceae bacterium]|nr:AAA family ATPase [Solirubrobacteraceae bacterium]
MLRIRLLGELAVETSSGPIQLRGSWRARSLLAWLALNPGSHRRADLAARFWPEVLDSSARASLRNAIWALRRTLGTEADRSLLATRERVSLSGPELWIDARAFRDHVEHERFEKALGLCAGELLAGLDEEWVHEYRDAHNERVSEVLERLAAQAETSGDLATAIALTRRRVALDPLAEDAQRALIVRLAAVGDRPGALGAYARLRDRLRRELGISPSQQTREIAAEIRDDASAGEPPDSDGNAPRRPTTGGWRPGAPFPLPPALGQPARSTFVGRGPEIAMLRQAWHRMRAGEGARMVLVTGEAGIGKTRLAREIALESCEQGAVVLHGSAIEDLLVPYQPFIEALRHYLAISAPDELQHRVKPHAHDLEPITPTLPPATDPPHPDRAPADSRRYRLFDAFSSVLGDLSSDSPVLLVLDDIQWADHSSIALLRHMLSSRPEMRLL